MKISLRFYLSLVMRRLPAMLALFLICAILGGIAALRLPPVYTTSARLLVEDPQIPESMVRSGTASDPAQQLQVVEQQLMTRANLIDIANKFQVFPDLREMTPDEVVSRMSAATAIRRQGGRDQATLMSVTFSAGNPRVAADVVNEYVTLILAANTRTRVARVENTLEFFGQEVRRLGEELDRQSALIVQFKRANTGALPDDLEFRQGRQALLQERQSRLERERGALIDQRRQMVAVFEATGRIEAAGRERLSPEEQQLNTLRNELQQALAIFSESNPRVKLLQSRITQLEAALASQTVASGAQTPEPTTSALDITLAEMDSRLAALEQELAEVARELEALEASIEATASNAIALAALERDYENISVRYNAAVVNLNQARVNERIEVSAQGQRISVIEGANVPLLPSGPNRKAIAAASLGMGMGLAGGLFVLLEILNRTIRRPVEMQSRFGITPLAAIPYIESAQDRSRRRILRISASLAVLIGLPLLLWSVHSQYMPLDLLVMKVLARVGLS